MNRHRRAAVAAFTFLTRLPVGALAVHDTSDLPLSVLYFPLVGVIVALIGGVTFGLASVFWSIPTAVVLSIAATIFATGAFHEDALADSFDGFGGGWTPDRVLAIMKDSRVGSYALVGVTLTLAIKGLALITIASREQAGNAGATFVAPDMTRALVAAHVLGRWSSVPLMWRYDYVRPAQDGARPSAGRPFIDGVTAGRVCLVSIATFVIVIVALGRGAAPAVLTAAIVTAFAGRYFKRRIGGITGDALGAANQLVEVGVYLALAARNPL